jgi:hypothetical protein
MSELLGTNRCGLCGARGHNARTCTTKRDEASIAVVAELREARDAIQADIVRLEGVRASVEERLVEAYEHRAKLDVRIRENRAGSTQ